ncbi:MAG: sulfate reduction electron transfer complex DsrMKJOP subunit DsrJ [Bacillota bacterium]|nr:sulfate reduction electron transfer complex DsrMKJOP subunit DsrJ [Bacillota bacterium]
MHNGRNIIIGLMVFLILTTYPVWSNVGNTAAQPKVSIDTPEIQAMEEKNCIKELEFMRSKHMELLSQWKNSVVRDNNRLYTSTTGEDYNMSLNTCFKCHSNKSQFCDSCHSFSGAKEPNCFSCHLEPREVI